MDINTVEFLNLPKLTPRQGEILALISQSIEESGLPPTRAEIATRLGFASANAAEEHLRALARKGYVELSPGTSRGIRIPPQAYSKSRSECLPNGPTLRRFTAINAPAHWASSRRLAYHGNRTY